MGRWLVVSLLISCQDFSEGSGGVPGLPSVCMGFVDADGDGLGAGPQGRIPCDSRPGFAENDADCDDESAERMDWVHPDEDGDGYGTSDVRCVARDSAAHSDLIGDCNDGDATVNPSMEEHTPLDGFDSNCDGADSVVREWAADVCQSPAIADYTSAALGECENSDLIFAHVERCMTCEGSDFWVVVANVGKGSAVPEVLADDAVFTTGEELGPGRVSEPISGTLAARSGWIYVRAAGDSADCTNVLEALAFSELVTDCPR
jgi:hypothetical protein